MTRKPVTWYAVYANPKCERRAMMGLAERGLQVFMPSLTKWSRHARTKSRVKHPLFIRYLFVGLDPAEPEFHIVRGTDGVESIVSITGQPIAIAGRLIDALRTAEDSGEFDLTREPTKVLRGTFHPHQPVRIVGGVLKGFNARVIRVLGRKNVRVLYQLFGRPGEAIIDPADLEAAEEPETQHIAKLEAA